MAEWSKAAVLKTVEGQPSQGSNPCLSAINTRFLGVFNKFGQYIPQPIWTTFGPRENTMATIDKRIGTSGTVTWRARVRAQGQTRIATFKRKTDATSWATNTEADLNKGKYVPTRADMRRTVSEAVDWYIDDYLPTKRRNKDQANPNRHLKNGGKNKSATPAWLI